MEGPRDIDRKRADLYHWFDYRITGGTEMRVLSAIDLALWDLLGKLLETPVYRLIGGRSTAPHGGTRCSSSRPEISRKPCSRFAGFAKSSATRSRS